MYRLECLSSGSCAWPSSRCNGPRRRPFLKRGQIRRLTLLGEPNSNHKPWNLGGGGDLLCNPGGARPRGATAVIFHPNDVSSLFCFFPLVQPPNRTRPLPPPLDLSPSPAFGSSGPVQTCRQKSGFFFFPCRHHSFKKKRRLGIASNSERSFTHIKSIELENNACRPCHA